VQRPGDDALAAAFVGRAQVDDEHPCLLIRERLDGLDPTHAPAGLREEVGSGRSPRHDAWRGSRSIPRRWKKAAKEPASDATTVIA
jgi:hypothetical protein